MSAPPSQQAKTAEPLERKSLIYRSGLGFHCVNHVFGCSHGCRYPCHGYLLAKRHGRVQDYAEWCRPRLVGNALELLERELTRKRKLPERVHLCLSTDPFMFGHPEIESLSLALIERLNRAGVSCSVLTKGLLPRSLGEEGRYLPGNTYGISLISLNEQFREKVEPGASPYAERIAALKRLADAGCCTRVHMEPYPTPNLIEQDQVELLESVAFARSMFFGGWNYQSRVAEYPNAKSFYRQAALTVQRFCVARGITYER